MTKSDLQLLLADDDIDDRIFFEDALLELDVRALLTTVADGAELMHLLVRKNSHLPNAVYLDLNMPLKNGMECLLEIKSHNKLKHLPVIIYSTSFNTEVVDRLYESGASYYIRKPADFQHLKKVILKSIHLISARDKKQTPKETFVINSK